MRQDFLEFNSLNDISPSDFVNIYHENERMISVNDQVDLFADR
jgi:hypothetical protein